MIVTLMAAAATGEAGGAFPAFEFWHWSGQIFWLIVTFTVLYFILSRFFVKKISASLEKRSDTIVGALDEAHRLNEQAEEARQALELRLSEARAKARETAAEAHAKVQADITRATEATEEKMNRKLDEAEARIAETRASAMSEVRAVAREAAEKMVGRFGGSASKTELDKALDAALPKDTA